MTITHLLHEAPTTITYLLEAHTQVFEFYEKVYFETVCAYKF